MFDINLLSLKDHSNIGLVKYRSHIYVEDLQVSSFILRFIAVMLF